MSLPKVDPTTTNSWNQLNEHFQEVKNIHLKTLFNKNPNRAEEFTIHWEDFYVDYSKNRITEKTKELLLKLAEEVNLNEAIEKYFGGDIINETENRAVLHTALRAPKTAEVFVDGKNVIPEIYEVKSKIENFSNAVINGDLKGFSGKAFTHIVNIGIGGSDLGPAMVVEALTYYQNQLKTSFISNVDGDHVNEVIKDLDPETTLFVIVSKSFTTQETLSNANTIRSWFLQYASEEAIAKHFVAVSTNQAGVEAFAHAVTQWKKDFTIFVVTHTVDELYLNLSIL